MQKRLTSTLLAILSICTMVMAQDNTNPVVLKASDYKHYVDYFNRMEDENIANAIPNAESWSWLEKNIPLFDCPQDNFREIYYYRWWSIRKHIIETPKGHVVSEFLIKRPYADEYNIIACAIGHHLYEMRWLHDQTLPQEYINFWYTGNEGGNMSKLRKFSSWTADALYNSYLINGDEKFLKYMYPMLKEDYAIWEADKRLSDGLYWQRDVSDGMEESASGGRNVKNKRPTINSYMYGNALALSKMATMFGEKNNAEYYSAKADTLKNLVQTKLWNNDSKFFETLQQGDTIAKVREAIGYIPWYFNLPDDNGNYDTAWLQTNDPQGFDAPFGLTTCEMRSPLFRSRGCCSCEWDGAIWPFATSQTLTGMANFLQNYKNSNNILGDTTYFDHMEKYVESQYYRGKPYIGEYQDEKTGYWLKGDQERSRYYNHSTFADLMISGLMGFRPNEDGTLFVRPLVPADRWDWFSLDNVLYKGHIITIVWDKTGNKYNVGKGLTIMVDGKIAGKSDTITKGISVKINKRK